MHTYGFVILFPIFWLKKKKKKKKVEDNSENFRLEVEHFAYTQT